MPVPTADTYLFCPSHKTYMSKKYVVHNMHAIIIIVVTRNNA